MASETMQEYTVSYLVSLMLKQGGVEVKWPMWRE